MDAKNVGLAARDREDRWMLRAGAYCAFAVVVGNGATFPLYALVGVRLYRLSRP